MYCEALTECSRYGGGSEECCYPCTKLGPLIPAACAISAPEVGILRHVGLTKRYRIRFRDINQPPPLQAVLARLENDNGLDSDQLSEYVRLTDEPSVIVEKSVAHLAWSDYTAKMSRSF